MIENKSVGGLYKPLSDGQVETIHNAALTILEDIGITYTSDQSDLIEELRIAGARVERNESRIRFDRKLIKQALSHAPSRLCLYSRNGINDLELCGDQVHFGNGGTTTTILDLDTGQCRPSSLDDIFQIARLVERLSNIDLFIRPCTPMELPEDAYDVNTCYAALKGTQKHVMLGIFDDKRVVDVIASINHHRKEDAKSGAKVLLKSITSIKKDGKNTLVFSLDQSSADFPFMLADIHITMMPAKGDDVDWQSGVGTGAYMLEAFEPGVRIALKRFPNHWNKNKGHFEQVEMLSIHDMAARTNALRTGRVDLIDRIDLKTVHLLSTVKGIKVNEITSLGHYAMPMNTGMAPFDNNDVRMALKYGIDRKALLKTLFKGHGQLGNDHPISPANRYFAKDIPQREYDPEKAKFHLKKAGLENLTVSLHAAGAAFPEAVDLAVLYKEYAAKGGITINVVREPNDGYWSDIWMKKPWCFCYWRGRPTEDWMFSSAYSADAKWNDTYWKHERFNKLLKEARSELKDAKRRELYAEMQRIVRDEGGQVIPLFNNYLLACTEKLEHGPMLRYADLDGYKLPERWWFAG